MSSCVRAMSATEKFVFDLQGFVVLRGVLSADDVAQANAAIDSHKSELKERVGTLRNSANTSFGGDGSTGRREAGTMLSWPKPDCNVFRKVLDHPRLVPYLNELCGKGYRMDHMPLLIAQYKGCEGFGLHGGRMNEEGEFLPELAYHCEAGRIYNPLLACSVVLSDHNPGDGGFVVVPGSHKANFATPPELVSGSDELADNLLVQPSTKAGDVILFSESTVHGAKPWTADHERRLVIYRFAPATHAYGRSYIEYPDRMLDGLTDGQRAVLQPPYANRLDREQVEENGQITMQTRGLEKRKWDEALFATPYF